MKLPIIIYNDTILKLISWFMSIGGITIWPVIILREKYKQLHWESRRKKTINHESIHIQQQQELLIVLFYLIYVLEFIIKLIIYGKPKRAYQNISFEREAYANDTNENYLKTRKRYNWIGLIFKSN